MIKKIKQFVKHYIEKILGKRCKCDE